MTVPPFPKDAAPGDVVELHRVRCWMCRRPIGKGEAYPNVQMPDGSSVPVHIRCLIGGGHE